MSAAPRNHVRRARSLLEAALPAVETAAAAVPRNATGMWSDSERALHYLRKAIHRADVTIESEKPVAQRRKVPRRGPGGQLEAL